jgi:hypothetical protein
MSRAVTKLLLWLFVINLGIAFGAGLYESRIVVPQWLGALSGGEYRWHAEAARQADSGLRFWIYVTTVPLTLLSIANLIVAWRARGTLRRWWLTASVTAVLDRIFTFSYFIPTMYGLMTDASLPLPQATALALQWVKLNHFRHLIVLVAWLAALKALSLSNESD